MKQIYTIRIAMLLFLGGMSFAAKSQCPTGALCNTGGTINSGQTLYISTTVSSAVTLKNGAKMIIRTGGKFTGDISGNNGSDIVIEQGGEFSPSNANSFSSTVENAGTINFSNANYGTNFQLNNTTGKVTWSSAFNDNGKIYMKNSACGTFTFNGSVAIQSKNTVIENEGVTIIKGSLTTAMNTSIINSGKFYTEGAYTSAGYLNNKNLWVVKGSSNLNSGDSIINLDRMVFNGSVLGGRDIRNEGLLWLSSGFQFNNGIVKQNNPGAIFRVGGSVSNNGTINGAGSFYIAGSISNNGNISGISSSQKLKVNKTISSGTTSNLVIGTIVLSDTNTYVGSSATRALCTMSTLPISISDLKGAHVSGDNKITWTSSFEENALRYDILYSTNGTNFTTLGTVNAKGAPSSYQYFHFAPGYGLHYYRLKMVDKDGSSKLSNIIVLRVLENENESASFTIAGNPFKERLSMMIQSLKQEQVVIRLMDQSGKIVKQRMVMLEKGMNNISIDQLSGLPTGTYIIGMVQDGKMKSVKVVKS